MSNRKLPAGIPPERPVIPAALSWLIAMVLWGALLWTIGAACVGIVLGVLSIAGALP